MKHCTSTKVVQSPSTDLFNKAFLATDRDCTGLWFANESLTRVQNCLTEYMKFISFQVLFPPFLSNSLLHDHSMVQQTVGANPERKHCPYYMCGKPRNSLLCALFSRQTPGNSSFILEPKCKCYFVGLHSLWRGELHNECWTNSSGTGNLWRDSSLS